MSALKIRCDYITIMHYQPLRYRYPLSNLVTKGQFRSFLYQKVMMSCYYVIYSSTVGYEGEFGTIVQYDRYWDVEE